MLFFKVRDRLFQKSIVVGNRSGGVAVEEHIAVCGDLTFAVSVARPNFQSVILCFVARVYIECDGDPVGRVRCVIVYDFDLGFGKSRTVIVAVVRAYGAEVCYFLLVGIRAVCFLGAVCKVFAVVSVERDRGAVAEVEVTVAFLRFIILKVGVVVFVVRIFCVAVKSVLLQFE